MTQKIITHLWFDKEAAEAAGLYTSLFPNSKITNKTSFDGTPSGAVELVTFELMGREFQAISAGPYFQFNPSVSLQVFFKSKEELDAVWERLSPGGMTLMELGTYPFSERFGWLQDRYGLSWQLLYTPEAEARVVPFIMFVGSVCGKAEEATRFWTSVFGNATIGAIQRYEKGEDPDREGSVKNAAFTLFGQGFIAMDSAYEHRFAFNEAISFIVNCDSQEEIDAYWEKLSAVPEAEQCGWLKDKFGFSWQIVPAALDEMLAGEDQARRDRVVQAFLQMKKFDLARLHAAYAGG